MNTRPGKGDPPRQLDPSLLLTTDELAVKLRTSPSTIRYWRYKGYGPVGFKAGRRVLYRVSDVDAWVERRADEESHE